MSLSVAFVDKKEKKKKKKKHRPVYRVAAQLKMGSSKNMDTQQAAVKENSLWDFFREPGLLLYKSF